MAEIEGNMDRFANRGVEVPDNPYDRGYWDYVLFRVTFPEPFSNFEARKQYREGYREAKREILAERREAALSGK